MMKKLLTPGLAMIAGVAIGAVAVQGLHAQAKPPAYVFAEITIKDQEAYTKDFLPVIGKTIQDAGGKFIARGGKTVSFSGAAPAPRVVITQYESLDKAQAWWNSQATKDAHAIGEKSATFRELAVEGVAQ